MRPESAKRLTLSRATVTAFEGKEGPIPRDCRAAIVVPRYQLIIFMKSMKILMQSAAAPQQSGRHRAVSNQLDEIFEPGVWVAPSVWPRSSIGECRGG
jgi:hypothetical protein